ncbi:MAG: hypothetical protein IJZ07_02355 [Clostridia bacterium]|nr:hypothetical protein [Clostridia bacterium]
MLSKLPKISKELLITGLIIFAAFNFRSAFSFTQGVVFAPRNIIYMLISSVPFTILITSKLSANFKKELKAVDIAAIAVILYTLAVILHDTVMRYSVLTGVCFVAVSLLLCNSIYALPVAAVLNLIGSFKFGYAAVFSVPVTICLSMVCFSYLFEKKKIKTSKKSKKSESVNPLPDYKKEKIIFAVSELVLFAALAVMIYYRKYTIALITFRSNLEYIIPMLIPAICFIIFAVLAIKNKRPFMEVIGYLTVIGTMPLTQLCEYSTAAGGVWTAFTLLFALCDSSLDSGKSVNNVYEKIIAKISAKHKTAKE